MDFVKRSGNRLPAIQAGRDFIGPAFDLVAKAAGELAIIQSIQSAAFCPRYIYPDLDRNVLRETQDSFDSHESILNYYGVDLNIGYEYFCEGQNDDNIEDEIPQRTLDTKEILLFINRFIARLELSDKKKSIQIIDFGAGFGAQAYKSQLIASDIIKSWVVVDLPLVVSSAKLIKERAIKLVCEEGYGNKHRQSIEKISFASSIEEIEIDEDSENIIIINGVWMHLADPSQILKELLSKIKPSCLMIGNNFEMGPNTLMIAKKYSRSQLIVSGTSGTMNHKFAVDIPGQIPQMVYDISSELGQVPSHSFVSIRDRVNLKLYQVVGENEFFVDSELNRCFHFTYM